MLEFVELKEQQKKYVIEVTNRFNHKTKDITLADMEFYHAEMKMTRDQGTPKFGYPNWLIVPTNKVSKSVYGFPIPTESELQDFISGKTEAVINIKKFSPLFQKTVKEYSLL
jgi:hypothetical protein